MTFVVIMRSYRIRKPFSENISQLFQGLELYFLKKNIYIYSILFLPEGQYFLVLKGFLLFLLKQLKQVESVSYLITIPWRLS